MLNGIKTAFVSHRKPTTLVVLLGKTHVFGGLTSNRNLKQCRDARHGLLEIIQLGLSKNERRPKILLSNGKYVMRIHELEGYPDTPILSHFHFQTKICEVIQKVPAGYSPESAGTPITL